MVEERVQNTEVQELQNVGLDGDSNPCSPVRSLLSSLRLEFKKTPELLDS
jgi:hypothetical protein